MMNAYHPERGAAAFYIILGIVLLAGLSFAVSQGFRFSDASLSNDQTRLAAQEIIDYSTTMASAVQRLRLRGCTDTQINFESTVVGAPNNPNAPSDDHCDVFSAAGARITPRTAKEFPAGDILIFSGQSALNGVGRDGCGAGCSDLYMALYLKGENGRKICSQINQILGNTALVPAPSTLYMEAYIMYAGAYGTHNAVNASFHGLHSACYNYSVDTSINIFYQVLLAR